VVALLGRGKTDGPAEEQHDMNSVGEGRCTCIEVTTIKTSPLIDRGEREECARTVNDVMDGVRSMHFHSVGGGEVQAPVTWLVLHWQDPSPPQLYCIFERVVSFIFSFTFKFLHLIYLYISHVVLDYL
jgi:hypothetical protein